MAFVLEYASGEGPEPERNEDDLENERTRLLDLPIEKQTSSTRKRIQEIERQLGYPTSGYVNQ